MIDTTSVDIAKAENLAVQCERLAEEVAKVTGNPEMIEMATLYAETLRAYVTMLQATAVDAIHNEITAEELSDGILR